jgi:phage-related protein
VREKRLQSKFFVSHTGKMPVREWILALDKQDKITVGQDMQRIEFEWPVNMPYCRPLGSGLWEIRSSISGSRITRIIFCIFEENAVMLHSFIKKTQKTPQSDLNLAKSRMKEVLTWKNV